MVIEVLNTDYVNHKKEATSRSGPSKNDLLQVQLIDQYIAIVSSYLKTIDHHYRKTAEQNRDHERKTQAQKSLSKGQPLPTIKAHASANERGQKELPCHASHSKSTESSNSNPSIAIGPSFA